MDCLLFEKAINSLIMGLYHGDEFEYYGFLNHASNPEGLGILTSGYEVFGGKFVEGSLDKYGMILFENGLLYKG